ncbi:MAG: Exodeoxyribonuclease [Candidatus Omnitrophica bacterium]|nr:Exodeoxyribonuclease [Candidatus Omnitrophota bacterium]
MKLLSWNVNGARACWNNGLRDLVRNERPDMLCIQETKAPAGGMTLDLGGYTQEWNNAQKPGYSGTATFLKKAPLSVARGIGKSEHDGEGRVLTTEHPGFFLVNTYVPNSQRTLDRLPYRQRWDADLLSYLKKLERKKPVVLCGDLNVAHQEIDLTYPKQNARNHGFTPEERRGFETLLKAGFVDAFREFEKGGGHYTWWSRLNRCRERNIGWRIDYFIVSSSLKPRLKKAWILSDVHGSDHCPVGLELR